MIIEYRDMEGRYFTQWRIDALKELLEIVVFNFGDIPLFDIKNVKIWYDDPNDYHMLSYEADGNQIEVQFYKVFTSKINGVIGWQGCPRHCITNFAGHLRNASTPVLITDG